MNVFTAIQSLEGIMRNHNLSVIERQAIMMAIKNLESEEDDLK